MKVNMLSFKAISEVFSNFLDGTSIESERGDQLTHLIRLNIGTNQKLWDLEDSARMFEHGPEYIATTKQELDKSNQIRNDLIREIDTVVSKQIGGQPPSSRKQFYSETPGMIVDRLSILFIKRSSIKELLSVIEGKELKSEYREKERVIFRQINRLGSFLDSYFDKLNDHKVYFEIHQPVKIYNDARVTKYIRLLRKLKHNS